MNFESTLVTAREGNMFVLSTGDARLDASINKIQRKKSYGIAAAPKVGKTKATDFFFVYNPYLDAIKQNKLDNIEWIYYTLEMDRITKEFDCAAFFMAIDHDQWTYDYKGTTYQIDGEYLQGKKIHMISDKESERIPISPEHYQLLRPIYHDRIVPLYGKWSSNGELLQPGKITIIEETDNPTGMWKYLKSKAKREGTERTTKFTITENGQLITKERFLSYTPNNPDKITIVITDHVRKLLPERGFSLKQTVDKWASYSTELRNQYGFSFVHVIHGNRGIANVERLKYAGEQIYPTGDDTKETGNLSEECSVFITLFNPNDEKYNLKAHMGVDLEQHPTYRSLHIVEQRNGPCPVHIQFDMWGGQGIFLPLFRH